jgi:hypothetical protein
MIRGALVSITMVSRADRHGSPDVDVSQVAAIARKGCFGLGSVWVLGDSESLVGRRCRSGDPEGNMEILLIRLTAVRVETNNGRVVNGG